jgi:hypothetical protein
MIKCPKCRTILNPSNHGYLVFDGQIWCDGCHDYDRELIRPRPINEIEAWSNLLCRVFDFPSVTLEKSADSTIFRNQDSVLMAEADRSQRSILFYPPGYRLTTLCHELAHIYTGHDHTGEWAKMFAILLAWVKSQIGNDQGPEGYQPRLSIYAGVPNRVY